MKSLFVIALCVMMLSLTLSGCSEAGAIPSVSSHAAILHQRPGAPVSRNDCQNDTGGIAPGEAPC